MDLSTRLRVASPHVVDDVVDDEVVIVNLNTGAYYNTEGAGCDAWRLLAAEITFGDVVTTMRARYEADEGVVERYLEELIDQFLAEGLMVVVDPAEEWGAGMVGVPFSSSDQRVPFEPAQLVQFNDMKGLLLLDPVHEVDERGWPHAAAGG